MVIKRTVTIMKERDSFLIQEEYFQIIEDQTQQDHPQLQQRLIIMKMVLRCKLKDHLPIAKEEINKELRPFQD